jgi:CDP-diacylglycerol--serine O-phosphatidyltransferase
MTGDLHVRRPLRDERHYRRGLYLLPTIFTVGNMFCGYACVIFAMRGELSIAAPFVGVAVVLDMLDGRIARLTKTSSAFGLELDSLADVISFGIAPAMLAFAWGLSDLGRFWWAAGFVYVTAAAMRLARFNLTTTAQVDKRYFIGMPSPAAAGLIASTVFAWPDQLGGIARAVAAVTIVLVPAALMVSTLRFRSFKTINLGWTQSYMQIIIVAVMMAAIATAPHIALVVLAYGYLLSAFIEEGLARYRLRRNEPPPAA